MNQTLFASLISLASVIVTVIGAKIGEIFLEWLRGNTVLKAKDRDDDSFAQKELVRQLTDELKLSRDDIIKEKAYGEAWRDKYYQLLQDNLKK